MRDQKWKTKLGFVITSYAANPLLARLIGELNSLYGNPPIVIHHDFGQSPLPVTEKQITKNIRIVRPHYKTSWAHISVIDAFLTSLDELYQMAAPDWFAFLSPSCYPVALAGSVLDELSTTPYDAFMAYFKLPLGQTEILSFVGQKSGERLVNPALPHAASSILPWLADCYHRYVIRGDGTAAVFTPQFQCFVGDHWMTGNAKTAAALIASRRTHCDLFYHYTTAHCPEESYYQTVLCNDPSLKISANSKRYADWSRQDAHPRELDLSDFGDLLASGCHFARKMSEEKSIALLDELDLIHRA